MKKRHLIAIGLIATAVVLLLFFAIKRTASENGAVGNAPPIVDYANREFGFSIRYPGGLAPETDFKRFYALPQTWRLDPPAESTGTMIVAIPVFRIDQGGVATGKSYPLYFDVEVRIGASDNANDIADCYKPNPGYVNQAPEDAVIRGLHFKKFSFENAAMMQYMKGASYRRIHNNECFAVEVVEAGSRYRDETMTPGLSDEELGAYYQKAEDIVSTFHFTD